MDYEILATSAVQNSISKTSRLSPYINSRDKEPSWDGNIYLHEDSKRTKHNLYKIPVQVKGKGVSKWNQNRITYPVSVIDLENYLNDGGIIFFVVYIDKETGDDKKIFYSVLLPKKINDLLKINNKKSISIVLQQFPDDEKGKINIFLFFKKHRELQAIMSSQPDLDVKELMKKGMVENMSFTLSALDLNEENIPQYLVNQQEMYLYAEIKGTGLSFPVEYFPNITNASVEKVVENPVCINGIQFYDRYKVIYRKDGNMIKFGESTVMKIEPSIQNLEQDIVQGSLKIKISGNLRSRTNDLEFALNMIEFRRIEIAGVIIPFSISEEKKRQFRYEKQQDNLKFLKKCCDVLDKLNIKKDLDIDGCTENNMKDLMRLYNCIVEKKTVGDINPNLESVNRIKLSNLNLLIAVKKDETRHGQYRLLDFFDCKINIRATCSEEEMEFQTSQFCILKCEDILNTDNINYENIVSDFMSIQISKGMIIHANSVLLEMIKAFDINKDEELYLEMLKLAEWIAEQDEANMPKAISQINKLQIIRRKRELNFSERRILYDIVRCNENEFCNIGALLLLGEHEEAKKRFSGLDERNRSNLKHFR